MLSHYYMVKFMGELRTKNLRQEKKYLLHQCKLSEFERKINLIGFRVNHEPNLINNIYFEDNLMTSASEGIEGDTNRCKYRMRWYNNASEFTIENKIKLSSSGKKIKSVLKAKSLTEALEEARFIFKRQPIIQNSYNRRYYIKDEFRITIDTNLKFNIPFSKTFKTFKKCIIEVKYKTEDHYSLDYITEDKLQLTKFSKYLKGLEFFKII